jgi:plasmid stabilization system protein ParE
MAYKIIFAPTAIARLEDIVRYIAADDPATAKTFAMHLLDRVKDAETRAFYIRKTVENGWSRGVLIHQIDTNLHKRFGKAA